MKQFVKHHEIVIVSNFFENSRGLRNVFGRLTLAHEKDVYMRPWLKERKCSTAGDELFRCIDTFLAGKIKRLGTQRVRIEYFINTYALFVL